MKVQNDSLDSGISRWELAAENIVVRIRWFGLLMGYALVNFVELGSRNRPALNAILAVGALYTMLDTIWSLRGRVFLSRSPLVISLLEAVFIGQLCYFDRGVDSPFRFYYFLSLVCCAIRYEPKITYTTCVLHSSSFVTLFFLLPASERGEFWPVALTVIVLGWVTWASTSLATLLKKVERRLQQLNRALQENQAQLEERIRERSRELEEAQASLLHQEKMAAFGLLAAGIAHEVGNPLASISSLVQLLQRRPQEPYTREKLALASDQLSRIQGTLRELVDFSRPGLSQQSRTHVHDAIQAALNIAKYYKRTERKVIQTDLGADVPAIRTTRDHLIQVLLNLILNAMDATGKEGHIGIQTRLERGRIVVRVSDDGHGIDPESVGRVFQPYFTTKEHGTGLGLFVSRRLVAEMGGQLWLESSSKEGTAFIVELPLAQEKTGRGTSLDRSAEPRVEATASR